MPDGMKVELAIEAVEVGEWVYARLRPPAELSETLVTLAAVASDLYVQPAVREAFAALVRELGNALIHETLGADVPVEHVVAPPPKPERH